MVSSFCTAPPVEIRAQHRKDCINERFIIKTTVTDEQEGQLSKKLRAFSSMVRSGVAKGTLNFYDALDHIQKFLDSRKLEYVRLVPPPTVQAQTIKMLNELRGWGLDEFWFSRNIPRDPRCLGDHPTRWCVLDVELGSPQQTFKEVCTLIRAQQLKCSVSSRLNFENIRLECDHDRLPNRTEWRFVDFGTEGQERSLAEERSFCRPNVTILWALLYNPMLLKQLAEYGVYGLWLSGCRNGGNGEGGAIHIGYEGDHLKIGTGHAGNLLNGGRRIPEFTCGTLA